MKILFDFLPIIVFFVVYKMTNDIIIATAVLIPATILQVGYTWWKHKQIEKMHIVSLALVVLLGGATVLMGDGDFIKWKPTIVNGLFALAFLGSQFIGNKNLIQRMMGDKISLPFKVWRTLNLAWVGFFIVSGLTNLYVAFNFSEEIWVDFKLFGLLGMTLVFIVLQGIYLSAHMQNKD
ncbi:septation protein A [Marinomonas mediterranea]|jgi:intracellular septation protein A|uniref:Inner membrane-spanning protein YciB n=1 Tax=Marinomonas mediterranea (strain ATCC 700492 / JCM 21426 / NBRC 103028 / MMB-1) TaxID=717774 RepID=F2K1J1_MARM1|nr:septation protein A [Marinomonas mediterranea]ADZ92221.1 intracellular septation protein [Marinomonas mediterranea MMB-1]WCN10179.1 septation protein A [Marinomonas mediterranea]WCN14224.1 septation protein A [Marinomonas mediterranea]WCN18280.1 septation protein A [Marinomonas mediterranea MMB-1]